MGWSLLHQRAFSEKDITNFTSNKSRGKAHQKGVLLRDASRVLQNSRQTWHMVRVLVWLQRQQTRKSLEDTCSVRFVYILNGRLYIVYTSAVCIPWLEV